jgi:hypothetical protein
MSGSGKIEQIDAEPRPIIVVAERDCEEARVFRGMDLLVFLYRWRWIVAMTWGMVLFASLALMPVESDPSHRWSFVVRSDAGGQSLDQLAGLLMARVSSLGEAAAKQADIEVQFPRMGSGAKAEIIRNAIVIRGSGDSAESPPEIVRDLAAMASEWTRQSRSDYIARQTEAVTVIRERIRAMSADENSSMADRSAAESSLATAEVNLKFPPQWSVLNPESVVKLPDRVRAWGIRLAGTLAVALLLVTALAGWNVVARAARESPVDATVTRSVTRSR